MKNTITRLGRALAAFLISNLDWGLKISASAGLPSSSF